MTERTYYLLLIISSVVVVCAVFWQSLFLPFIQDDWNYLQYINANETTSILKQFFDFENKLFYRPLTNGYLLLVYRLIGPNPIFFHVEALIFHVINSCLVALIIRIITRDRFIGYLTALVYAAGIAIHLDPLASSLMGIEVVGSAFFFFMTMWLYLNSKPILGAILYFIGCLFKEAVIPLPILLFSYSLLMNSTFNLREKKISLHVDWKQIIPFLPTMIVILIVKLSSGISPFEFSASHPYVIDLVGMHVVKNFLEYLVWMFQTILPLLSLKTYEQQFFIFSVVLVLLYCVLAFLVVFRLREDTSHSRRILFLLIWILIGLLPSLFFPNHTYRYYATLALPPFIGLFLYLLKYSLLSFNVKQKIITVIMIGLISFAVSGSILQGNKVYREGLNQTTLSDFTNLHIQRAAYVNIVQKGLLQLLPSPPSNAVIVLGNTELWSFHKNSGPQFWYDDNTIRVYSLSDLKFEAGQPYIESPVENQVEAFTGPTNKKVFLDISKLFVYTISNGELVRIDLQELK